MCLTFVCCVNKYFMSWSSLSVLVTWWQNYPNISVTNIEISLGIVH